MMKIAIVVLFASASLWLLAKAWAEIRAARRADGWPAGFKKPPRTSPHGSRGFWPPSAMFRRQLNEILK